MQPIIIESDLPENKNCIVLQILHYMYYSMTLYSNVLLALYLEGILINNISTHNFLYFYTQ